MRIDPRTIPAAMRIDPRTIPHDPRTVADHPTLRVTIPNSQFTIQTRQPSASPKIERSESQGADSARQRVQRHHPHPTATPSPPCCTEGMIDTPPASPPPSAGSSAYMADSAAT
jgi:hypothetical protein